MLTNKINSKYLVLVLLALVFFLPGMAALAVYTHPQWLSGAGTHKGHLVQTPPLLGFMEEGKWRLVFWNPGECREHCQDGLQKLAKIRLSLGRRLYQVDQYLIFSQPPETLPADFSRQLQDKDIRLKFLSDEQKKVYPLFGSEPAVFIVSPENYLIMTYTASALPADIFHDLNRLLQAGGGKANV